MAFIDFKGKSIVQNHHLSVKYHELIPDEKASLSKQISLKDNLIIHGDNLIGLKALLPTYAGKVDCIYIDPPYNTGEEKWAYNDNVNSPMMQEWLGKVVDKDDLTRHDKWLCMMMPRLKLLKELLRKDGVIFVSIDYNELHNLRSLMDEIFGEQNYKDTITIRRGVKNVQAQFDTIDSLSKGYESVLVYSKTPKRRFNKIYEEVEEKPGSWNNHWRGTDRSTMRKPIFGITIETGQWRWGDERNQAAIKNYEEMVEEFKSLGWDVTDENIDKWYLNYLEENEEDELDLLRLSDNGVPEHYIPPTSKKLLSNLWYDLKPNGSSQLKKIFGKKVFDNPKSTDLVKRLITFATKNPNAIILDSFAGSGTTAHAVLDLNGEDQGNRKFILIEMEDYADRLTAERVRRVIKGMPNCKDAKLRKGLGGSFSFFNVGQPLEIDKILSGERLPSFNELARYIFYTATGEGFDEKSINPQTGFIGETTSYQVFLLYKPDIEYLKTTALNLEAVKKLGEYTGKKRLVFAPMKFLDRAFMEKYNIEYCQLPFDLYKGRKE